VDSRNKKKAVGWIDLAQDREKWRVISCLAEEPLASQEGFCFVELVSWLVSQSVT
jgi:hypothetical protein